MIFLENPNVLTTKKGIFGGISKLNEGRPNFMLGQNRLKYLKFDMGKSVISGK